MFHLGLSHSCIMAWREVLVLSFQRDEETNRHFLGLSLYCMMREFL